jgi:hypothetical protein
MSSACIFYEGYYATCKSAHTDKHQVAPSRQQISSVAHKQLTDDTSRWQTYWTVPEMGTADSYTGTNISEAD